MNDAATSSCKTRVVATILAIAATYGYFLLFAEFALLELAKPLFGGEAALRPLLAVLCAGGVTGSFLAAWRFEPGCFRGALATGFVGCAVSAAATLVVGRTGLWWAVAGVGVSLGWTTVTLSSGLRAVAGAARLGLWCGLGTGLAYAVSNVPAVFAATPQRQTMIALSLALLGGLAAIFMKPGRTEVAEAPDHKPLGRFLWGVIFLALVWLDSAGFYVLQHNYALRAQTWSGEWTLWGNAVTHLLGALLAGYALDARRMGITALVALVLLAFADTLLNCRFGQFVGTRVCYTMGVSAYSVALVYYPAIGARPWVAARLFAVAGWIGSALGIGMVQDLHAIPMGFIGFAAGVVLIAMAVRQWSQRSHTAVLVIGLGALCFSPRPVLANETNPTRGREVYLAEGCINCHSQYVRPRVAQEVLWWGPARPLAETLAETPPLIGLRRQGPDLMNVGNRRSPEWQRLHLISPQAVLPGSRMPSYAYLFQGADDRGESLIAYLATLGAETLPARLLQIASWTPAAEAIAAPFRAADARQQFVQRCASCHGTEGRGDGPLAAQLSLKPPDFLHNNWRHVLPNEPVREVALARIIKFGVPGTAMAGHEYLDDSSVVQLARFVEATHH